MAIELPGYLKRPRRRYESRKPDQPPAPASSEPPTVADVDAKLSALEHQRSELSVRLTELHAEIGTYLPGEPPKRLLSEVSRVNDLLLSFPNAEQRLKQQRRDAIGREIVDNDRKAAREIAEMIDRLTSTQPEFDQLQAQYYAALAERDELRSLINARQGQRSGQTTRDADDLADRGILREISGELAGIQAEFPNARQDVMRSEAEFMAFKQHTFARTN